MYLYESDRTTLIDSDDDSGDGLNAKITWPLSANTTYYVMVRGFSSSTSGSYSIDVTANTGGLSDVMRPDALAQSEFLKTACWRQVFKKRLSAISLESK